MFVCFGFLFLFVCLSPRCEQTKTKILIDIVVYICNRRLNVYLCVFHGMRGLRVSVTLSLLVVVWWCSVPHLHGNSMGATWCIYAIEG